MVYRPEENDKDDYDASEYWKRKQSLKDNKVSGEAPVRTKADRNAEAENFSFGKGPKDPGGKTIWDDD
jgi:hypothetical protein